MENEQNESFQCGFNGQYRFLSNFWIAPLTFTGYQFPSNEHAYQAAKSKNIEIIRQFTDSNMTPAQAKKLGRHIEIRIDWEDIKVQVMYQICRAKFTQHIDLKEKLLATGNMELLEWNTWGDTIWGIYNGKGENLLGKILMLIRSELKLRGYI